jgi:hypothetical protein
MPVDVLDMNIDEVLALTDKLLENPSLREGAGISFAGLLELAARLSLGHPHVGEARDAWVRAAAERLAGAGLAMPGGDEDLHHYFALRASAL